jgi:PilZ domain-containing protein
MSDSKSSAASADWTQLLSDPDLVSHLGKLLQTYRDAAPDRREDALLEAMREIKSGSTKKPVSGVAEAAAGVAATAQLAASAAAPAPDAPPFEPDIFTPSWGQDRRKYPRLKCFVAVEIHLEGSSTPIWGNLSDTSLGGCFVESSSPVSAGAKVEIGLWLSSGKLWVKGIVLNGVVTKSTPSFGIRVRFSDLESAERETLREFLKFVESTTRGYKKDHGYLAQIKR